MCNIKIGQEIKIARIRKKISQKDLAIKIGVSKQAVCSWENDVKFPNFQNLLEIAQILEINLDEIKKSKCKCSS